MARLPWPIRNVLFSPYEVLPIALENKIFKKFSYFTRNCMLCVLIINRGDANEYTQNTIIV